jgi:hypothetical protein
VKPAASGKAARSTTRKLEAARSRIFAHMQYPRLIDAPSVSLQRQLQCIRREIKLRRGVYITHVATRRMSARKAPEGLACMEAVAQTSVDLIEGRQS